MIDKPYLISFEIAGPTAMFARPDTGSTPISYPILTASAAKCMFESVAFSNDAYFVPQRVEICSPIVYHKYTTNYQGPLRKTGTNNFQFFATVLENVCYKVHGVICAYDRPTHLRNAQHELQAIFNRRLAKGQFFSTPFLGWKEFVPSYFGELRDTTTVDKSINMVIPSIVLSMHSRPTNGCFEPTYALNVMVEKGVMYYSE